MMSKHYGLPPVVYAQRYGMLLFYLINYSPSVNGAFCRLGDTCAHVRLFHLLTTTPWLQAMTGALVENAWILLSRYSAALENEN